MAGDSRRVAGGRKMREERGRKGQFGSERCAFQEGSEGRGEGCLESVASDSVFVRQGRFHRTVKCSRKRVKRAVVLVVVRGLYCSNQNGVRVHKYI